MITSMRGCVSHNHFWPWPISSRSFSHDFAIKWLKYGTFCRVCSTACTVLDGFFPYLAQMITNMRGCVACNDLWPQGWGQFRNWNWNWCQFQFQFQELELKRNWIKGIGIGIDKEELEELIQFLFLIVNSFWFFAMFLAESLNQFDLKPFWIQLTRISLDRYIILYDNLSIKWILHGSYWPHL